MENLKSKETKRIGFLDRVKISIFEFDKYYKISAESWKSTMIYILELVLIFSLFMGFAVAYKLPQMTNENIQQLLNTFNNPRNLYIAMFLYAFTVVLIIDIITVVIDILALALIGKILCGIAKIPLTFQSLFSIAASSATLSIMIDLVYLLANLFFDFKIEYYHVLVVTIANIYLIVSILSFKTNTAKFEKEEEKV